MPRPSQSPAPYGAGSALEHERNYGLCMDALAPLALGTRTESCFGHGCAGHRMLLENERNHALGMKALVIVCSWNTSGIMVWAWMLWSPYALGTQAELRFGHGCSGHHTLLEHKREFWFGHGCSGHRMLLE